ncbi:MAG: hypothetical protein FWC79_04930 [Oscillospiraceae bacterium]|nr:hypothetical protein [Oscillospiraceae bacterium]
MKDKKNWTKWIYWFTLAVAIVMVFHTVDSFEENVTVSFGRLMSVLRPFLLAILVAYLFYIPCRAIERLYAKVKVLKKAARPLSVFTAYILVVLLVIMAVNVILPAVSSSVIDLANNLPGYYREAIAFIDTIPDDSIVSREALHDIIYTLESIDITTFINPDNISAYISGVMRSSKYSI